MQIYLAIEIVFAAMILIGIWMPINGITDPRFRIGKYLQILGTAFFGFEQAFLERWILATIFFAFLLNSMRCLLGEWIIKRMMKD